MAAGAPVKISQIKSNQAKPSPTGATRPLPPRPAPRAAAARTASPWFGPARPQLPAALGGGAPHLAGAIAGDYGFDPLGLAREPAAFGRLHEAELLHARCGGGEGRGVRGVCLFALVCSWG